MDRISYPLVSSLSMTPMPVTVGLMSFMAYNEVLWGQMAAATVITIVPEIILALLVQPYMIRGLTFGAVK